ncbi:MAG: hypothetical protein R3A45_01235 [Bdellovibrionota bacterium]
MKSISMSCADREATWKIKIHLPNGGRQFWTNNSEQFDIECKISPKTHMELIEAYEETDNYLIDQGKVFTQKIVNETTQKPIFAFTFETDDINVLCELSKDNEPIIVNTAASYLTEIDVYDPPKIREFISSPEITDGQNSLRQRLIEIAITLYIAERNNIIAIPPLSQEWTSNDVNNIYNNKQFQILLAMSTQYLQFPIGTEEADNPSYHYATDLGELDEESDRDIFISQLSSFAKTPAEKAAFQKSWSMAISTTEYHAHLFNQLDPSADWKTLPELTLDYAHKTLNQVRKTKNFPEVELRNIPTTFFRIYGSWFNDDGHQEYDLCNNPGDIVGQEACCPGFAYFIQEIPKHYYQHVLQPLSVNNLKRFLVTFEKSKGRMANVFLKWVLPELRHSSDTFPLGYFEIWSSENNPAENRKISTLECSQTNFEAFLQQY